MGLLALLLVDLLYTSLNNKERSDIKDIECYEESDLSKALTLMFFMYGFLIIAIN